MAELTIYRATLYDFERDHEFDQYLLVRDIRDFDEEFKIAFETALNLPWRDPKPLLRNLQYIGPGRVVYGLDRRHGIDVEAWESTEAYKILADYKPFRTKHNLISWLLRLSFTWKKNGVEDEGIDGSIESLREVVRGSIPVRNFGPVRRKELALLLEEKGY